MLFFCVLEVGPEIQFVGPISKNWSFFKSKCLPFDFGRGLNFKQKALFKQILHLHFYWRHGPKFNSHDTEFWTFTRTRHCCVSFKVRKIQILQKNYHCSKSQRFAPLITDVFFFIFLRVSCSCARFCSTRRKCSEKNSSEENFANLRSENWNNSL